MTIITGTLHADQYTLLIISRSVLLRMRNFSDKFVKKIETNFLCVSNFLIQIVPFMR